MATANENGELCTPAWLMIGMTGSAPGVLEMAGGRIGYTQEEGRLFEAELSEITVKFPWYYFGGGCKITTSGETYRLSFVKPNGAQDVPGGLMARTADDGAGSALGGAFALLTAGRKLQDIGTGRRAGKAWRAALASRM